MDISQFPLEVLEVLAQFLSMQDISACSAVSVRWRDVFNLDLFWRKYCGNQSLTCHLQKNSGLVEPLFRDPTCTHTMLDSLCSWRVHAMRKAHLFRNWSKGRWVMQRMKFPTPVVNCTLGMDSSGAHWLVVNLGDRTEVWSVQNSHHLYATVGNITGAPSYLDIVADKLIIVDFFYLVQVFHLRLPTLGFAPSSKFFYTDSGPLCVDLSNDADWNAVRSRLRSSFSQGHTVLVIDNLLVGYQSYVEAPKEDFMHIWNIDYETKFSQETILSALHHKLRTTSCSVYVSSDVKTKHLLCSLYLFDKYISKLVLYSLKYKKFTNFSITVSGKVDWCDISGNFVATSHLLHQLHIYNIQSGSLVNIVDTNTRVFFGPNSGLQYQMMDPYIIQPSRESVKVINIQDHLDSLLLYFYSVYKVISIPPQFIAVSARPYVTSNKMVLEVWNVKEKMRMFDYTIAESDCPAYHIIHPLLTKTVIALGKSVKLLSFW